MKQEAEKKSNKKLLLIIGLAVLLVVIGVLLAIFLLPGQGGESDTVNAKLYWNIDRVKYTENAEVEGLSTREKEEDGFYHILLAVDGQQVDYTCADKQLVNYLDSMSVFGLTFGEDGSIVDVLDPTTLYTVTAESFYVQNVDGDAVTLNSSYAMNGMEIDIVLPEACAVYDVDPTAEVVGAAAEIGLMDMVSVYSDAEGNATYAYIIERAPVADVYWRVERCYDTETKRTTREPDENGVYTILFAKDGELVELKCKDSAIVNHIDSSAPLIGEFALLFDEEGYISGYVNVALSLRGKEFARDYHVTAIDGDQITLTRISAGSDQGKVVTVTLNSDCKIYQCCRTDCYEDHCGEVTTELKLYDRVNVYSDLKGNPVLIFVTVRLVDSPMYYNLTRKYSTAEGGTTREKDEKGYYVFDMLADGDQVRLRTKDKAIADSIDYLYHGCCGFELDGDIIKCVYDAQCVAGYYSPGYRRYVTSLTGSIFQLTSASDPTNVANCIMSADCKIYDVTGNPGVKKGTPTTLQLNDRVIAWYDYKNEVSYIYVTDREVEVWDYCDYCQKKVKWDVAPTTGFGTIESGEHLHYVVGQDFELTWGLGVLTNGTTMCLNLYGSTITHPSRMFIAGGSTLNIMGGGSIISTGIYKNQTLCTGNVTVFNGTLNLYDSTLKSTSSSAPAVALTGKDAVVNLNGGKIVGGVDINSGVANLGGKTTVLGEKGEKSGNIYVGTAGRLNVKADWTGTASVKVAVLSSVGISKTYGTSEGAFTGKLYYESKGNPLVIGLDGGLVVQGEIIPDENDPDYRMCEHCGEKVMWSPAPVSGHGTVESGEHIHYYLTDDFDSAWGYLVLNNKTTICLDLNGYSIEQTGRIFIIGNSVLNIMGDGTVTTNIHKNETLNTGSISVSTGTLNIYSGTYDSDAEGIPAIALIGKDATVNLMGGSVVAGVKVTNGTLNLGGNATVLGAKGEKSGNILISPDGMLCVAADWTGTASAQFEYLSNGTAISATNGTSEGSYTGKLYYECQGNPLILGKDGMLVVDGVIVPDENDPNYRLCEHCGKRVMWSVANASGLSSKGSGEHYHLYLTEDFNQAWGYLTVTDATTICLDLNGHNITQNSRIFIASGSTLNIMGEGTVTSTGTHTNSDVLTGSITVNSGTVNIYGGTYTATGVPAITLQNSVSNVNLLGGKVVNGIKVSGGVLTLGADAVVLGANGEKSGNIVVSASGKLNVKADWTGSASAKFEMLVSGMYISATNGSSEGAYTGKLYYEGAGNPPIIGEGGLLVIDGEVLPDENDPNYRMCEHCGEKVMWVEANAGGLSQISDGNHYHYFLGQNFKQAWNYLIMTNNSTVCLDLNGYTVEQNGRIFVGSGCTLNVVGEGTVTTKTHNNSDYNTGAITVNSGTVNIYSGTITSENSAAPAVSLLTASSKVNVLGGKVIAGINAAKGTLTIDGDAEINDAAGQKTDVIYVDDSAKLIINGDWTGSAEVIFENITANPVVNGECTGSYTGSLTTTIDNTPYNVIAQSGKLYIDGYVVPDDGDDDDQDEPANDGMLHLDENNMAMCEHCGVEVEWTAITSAPGMLRTGEYHYYLVDDMDNGWANIELADSAKVCLHLNGNTLSNGRRIRTYNATTLSIMGAGTVTGDNENPGSNNQATIEVAWKSTVNIYGGTYTSTASGVPTFLVNSSSATLNLHNATVTDGISFTNGTVTLSGSTTVDSMDVAAAGHLHVEQDWTGSATATFAGEIVEGVIPNGTSSGAFSGTLTTTVDTVPCNIIGKDGVLVIDTNSGDQDDDDDQDEPVNDGLLHLDENNMAMCEHCGVEVEWTAITSAPGMLRTGEYHYYLVNDMDNPWANIELADSAKVCLHLNGNTLSNGRRIRTYNATTLSIMGAGTVTGDNENPGSNNQATIEVAWKSTVNIYGGTYTSTASGVPTFLINSSSATLNLFSGQAKGDITLTNGTVNLSGDAKADNIAVASGKLNVNSDWTGTAVASFATLTDLMEIPEANGTSGGAYTGTLTLNKADGLTITGSEGKLVVNLDAATTQIVQARKISKAANAMDFSDANNLPTSCPVCGDGVTWTAITSTNTDVNMTGGSHYYLSDSFSVTSTDTTAYITGVGCLHLNGKELTVTNTRAIMPNGKTLNVMGTGTVSGYIVGNSGAAVHLNSKNAGAAINLYGGTYKKYNEDARSSVIFVGTNGGTVNMYEGVTIDASGKTNTYYTPGIAVYGNVDTSGNGGKAVFNMYGGTVIGGTVKESNTQGSSVTVGYYNATSGIWGDAVFNMYAGTIQNGVSGRYGGNINVTDNGTFNMYGGMVKDGNANYTQTGEATTASYGGNIALIKASSVVNLYGGTVSGGTALTRGGNIYVNAGTLTLSGDATVSGGSSNLGDNIAVSASGKLNVLNDWTGTASIEFVTAYSDGDEISEASAQCGSVESGSFVAGGSFDGTLTYELTDLIKIVGFEGKLIINPDHSSDNKLMILGIGNSFTIDSMTLLYDVYKAENPSKQIVIGFLYYSGCSLQQHVTFLQEDSASYDYYKTDSGIYDGYNGDFLVTEDVSMKTALLDEPWDIVSLQQNSSNTPKANTYNENIGTIRSYVCDNLGYAPEFAWNFTWGYPDDAELLNTSSSSGFAENFFNNYGTTHEMYNQISAAVQEKIVNGSYSFDYLMPVGTAIQNARQYGLTAKQLYRDYCHLNNLGRFIAAYTWYCEIEGYDGVNKMLTELNLTTVPTSLALSSGVRQIDADMEQLVINAVNNALKNKFSVTSLEP